MFAQVPLFTPGFLWQSMHAAAQERVYVCVFPTGVYQPDQNYLITPHIPIRLAKEYFKLFSMDHVCGVLLITTQ